MAATGSNKIAGFSKPDALRIAEAVRKVEQGGPSDETRIGLSGPGPQYLDALITSSAWDNTKQWFGHAWSEINMTASGWAILTGGRTGTTTVDPALNTETFTGSATTPSLSDTPTPEGTTVRLRVVFYWDSTVWKPRYLFSEPVAMDTDAKITAATAINGAIRAKYTLRVGHRDMSSEVSTGGAWVDDSDGVDSFGWDTAEDMNTFTSGNGTIGTGNTVVDQANGTLGNGTCALLFLPEGGYVSCTFRGFDYTTNPPVAHYTITNAMNSAEEPA